VIGAINLYLAEARLAIAGGLFCFGWVLKTQNRQTYEVLKTP
jgi:hypothetical protein